MKDFRSDNVAGASQAIIESIIHSNKDSASSYGDDKYTARLISNLENLFEKKVSVYPVSTGTAANAICFASSVPSYGAIFCSKDAHAVVDECNAPEFYTGGAKVIGLNDFKGKITADSLAEAADGIAPHGVHNPQPSLVSLTQATEVGTVYTPKEIESISKVAHDRKMYVHIDGARIANAVVSLNCSWSEITWKAGVDLLSFGATKNGALAAEAAICFRDNLFDDIKFYRKRGGHLFSKMRFLSAQLNAYIEEELWKKNAQNANYMAKKLADGLKALPEVELVYPVEANGVFIRLPEYIVNALYDEGYNFDKWGKKDSNMYRLMTSFNSEIKSVQNLIQSAQLATKKNGI